MHPFLRYAREKEQEIADLIRAMVEHESPSDSPAHVDRFVDFLIDYTSGFASAETIASERYGRHLRLAFQLPVRSQDGQILGLGHSDTVWPAGTLDTMPWRMADGRFWGPGVLDMKAGLAIFLFAVKALRNLQVAASRPVVLLIVSDEEVGSPASRRYTEDEARKSNVVLVLEPGTGMAGKLKTARKGIGRYTIDIHGRASHAGVDFAAGASAIVEAAHQIQTVAAFTDPARGITVNPGVIHGGTRSNVVAAHAQVELDVRVTRLSDAEELHTKLHSLQPADARCHLDVAGALNRPPMERTATIAELFENAKLIGRQIGVELEESATGGGSDGNFTAALGIPTLDGIGAIGEGAHASNESVLVERIPDRIALVAGLLSTL